MTMVTTDPVAGVQAKLRRARSHLVELERGAAAYLDDTPFGVYTVADPTTGPVSYRVHVRAKPPEDLGLMLGDALHNARSALDHVVWSDGRTTVLSPTRAWWSSSCCWRWLN